MLTSKDTLAVCGEVFSKGYVNGLIDCAKAAGAKVLCSTVGRRDGPEAALRPLSDEELNAAPHSIINVPLEAGFGEFRDKSSTGITDKLKTLTMRNWDSAEIADPAWVEQLRLDAQVDFKRRLRLWADQVLGAVPSQGGRLIVVHTMAGGFFRSRVLWALANRVFKGVGTRYLSSRVFWQSPLGKLCEKNFLEVSAYSFEHLINAVEQAKQAKNRTLPTQYWAYGYHGCECLVQGDYQWQSYAPYLQGWAKLELEQIATRAQEQGRAVTVFNVPEILSQSSSVFLGVEVGLYALLGALQKEGCSTAWLERQLAKWLLPGRGMADIQPLVQGYLDYALKNGFGDKSTWPHHNARRQMQKMQQSVKALMDLHKDAKHSACEFLSDLVVGACGHIMSGHKIPRPPQKKPIEWIGHKEVAQRVCHALQEQGRQKEISL